LKALRRDLNLQNIRGNVDTRLRKLDHGQYDAILLAAAGLKRLGWAGRITEYLDPAVMCPAVGQGALAIETRDDGGHAFQTCRRLNDARTERCVQAERSVLATLGGGCQVPIGAHANLSDDGSLLLLAVVVSPQGSTVVRKETTSRDADPCALGRALGEELLESGAREILEAVYT
jgi:hydroxymethylbilane synthase